MTPPVTIPIGGFSIENPMPYFQPPTWNPRLGFSNSRGGVPIGSGVSPLHGSGGPPEGGTDLQEEAEAYPWMEVDPQVAKDFKEEVEVDFQLEHRCAFWCSLAKFPLEPMVPTVVSTTSTHYHSGSFIKEIIVVSNLLY